MSGSQRYVTADVAGETFLLDEQTGSAFRLGGTGGRMWELLSAGGTVEEAARTVAAETGAPYERVLADTRAFVDTLRRAGVVVRDPEPGPQE